MEEATRFLAAVASGKGRGHREEEGQAGAEDRLWFIYFYTSKISQLKTMKIEDSREERGSSGSPSCRLLPRPELTPETPNPGGGGKWRRADQRLPLALSPAPLPMTSTGAAWGPREKVSLRRKKGKLPSTHVTEPTGAEPKPIPLLPFPFCSTS